MKRVCVSIVGLLFVIGLLLLTLARPQTSAGACATNNLTVDCENIWDRWKHGKTFYEYNPTYTDPYDDTADWSFSTPEEQGMDSTILNQGLANLSTNDSLFSVLIVRNGYLVVEEYYHGGAVDESNNIHSASKSMLSALVGIAIDQGHINSIDQKVSDIIPQYFVGGDPDKEDITVRHLLEMSAGLSWTEDNTEYWVEDQPDWVQAIIDRNLVDTPGSEFNYSTGFAHVLSAVIQEATGMSTCEYAHQNLLEPIGIAAEHWGRDPQAIYSGGYNLYMTPREMAKFALLYLNGGNWDGQQIVPQAWVNSSTQKVWTVDADFDYAQMWWRRTLDGHDMYFAWGWGGQFIYVIPDLNVVFVTSENTAEGHNNVEINSGNFIENYLIPSIEQFPTPTATSGPPPDTPTPPDTPDILLVDDDEDDNFQTYYADALTALGYTFDTWTVESQGSPSAATLQNYDIVVWLTAYDYDTSLTSSERASLETYLDNGGSLFVSGQDIGWDIRGSSFYGDYLHASYIRDDTNTYDLSGADFLAGVNVNIQGGDGANNQTYPSEVSAVNGGFGVFDYSGSYTWGGVAADTGVYKVVYFSFGFEAIDNASDRNAVMSSVIDWLN